MADQVEAEPDLPEEVTESLETFHESLGKVEDVFKPLLETSVDELKEKVWRFVDLVPNNVHVHFQAAAICHLSHAGVCHCFKNAPKLAGSFWVERKAYRVY